MNQLNEDCLNEIFKNLDKTSLYSCLFVSHAWCLISVRLLWRSLLNYKTLLSCLPNESKNILRDNEILVPTLKTPFFDYASFCKGLYLERFHSDIEKLFNENEKLSKEKLRIVSNELLKLLVNKASLKKLVVNQIQDITNLDSLLRVNTFLQDLSELYCHSNLPSNFYCQLSQICHKIQFLDVLLDTSTSDRFADFISVQRNLEALHVWQFSESKVENVNRFFSSIPNSIVELVISGSDIDNLYSLLNNFDELKKLKLSLKSESNYNKFEELNLPKLESLTFSNDIQPKNETLFRFLVTHGTNIKEFNIENSDSSLNNHISQSCQNIKKIYTGLDSRNLKIFKMFIEDFQDLESIKINVSGSSNEKELFEIIENCSQESFYEIELYYLDDAILTLLPVDLKSFILGWKDRTSHKLSIIFNRTTLSSENIEVLDEYTNLDIIKYRIIKRKKLQSIL